ncbi:contractile injection system protein, VgrG/Pvc8 family [Flocculibacter collagenilyticus]|uniref:contractile injection system protein, VgrG/Pvc8 family n=1 Tax=Flocculibacter collagenilyticus TaxID=2744479 RepID=UPI0018F3C298|nr:polymorphic toxin type 15 domain-containing protein [Flocculibacter collagenilyticus]
MTKDLSRTRIALHCLDSRLSVMHVAGEEQLNGAFRYCVWIEVPQTVDCFSILGQSVVLEFIAPDGHSRMLAGAVCEVEARGRFMLSNSSTHHVPVPYRRFAITLTSRLEALQGTEHSRVFVDTDVATLLTCLASEAGYHPSQIDWRLSQSLPGCPQFVQAMESNYQLFQRIVAQYGLLYWFETQHQQEILVISDGNLRSPYLSRTAIAVYSSYGFDRAGLQLDKSSELHGNASTNTNTGTNTSNQTQGRARLPFVGFNSIEERCRYTANRVTTTTLSHPPLRHGSHPDNDTATARANAARAGQGKHLAHYEPVAETVSAAASFATHQSLAQQALATTLTLTGNVPDIFAGCSFTLDDRSRLNASGDYLCIKVSHTSQQPADESRQDGLSKHSCTVTCIPRSTPYKSTMPRPTDKPMLFSARVESPSQHAQLTAQGDYITRLVFDDTARAVGQGGRPLKKLAMYACANQSHATGWHFPLVNDSQVLVGCMNNDPNQSYIVGFCMNEAQPSVVTSATPHHNRLTSSAGHQLLFDDSPTAPQILLHTLGVTPEQSAQHIVLNGSTQPMLEWVSRFGSVNLYAGTDLCLHAEEADVRYVVHGNQCIDVTGTISQTTAKDSMHYQAATTLDTHTGSQTHTANADISWLSGRSVNAHANSDIAINTPNGAINLSVPQGSTVLQVDGNITIKGTGQGDIRLHNQGGEIKLDSQGNVSLIGKDMLTLNGAMITLDGPVDYQISGPETASAPSTVSPSTIPRVPPLTLNDDTVADVTPNDIQLAYQYQDGEPVQHAPYILTVSDGTQVSGQLDGQGQATIPNMPLGQYLIQLGEDTRDYQLKDAHTTPNPLYGKITPTQAVKMVEQGDTSLLDQAGQLGAQAGDWLWGTLQGDFNEHPSTSQIVVGSLISMIPVVDQIMDCRDVCANAMLLTDDNDANDTDGWIALTLTGIGFVPVVGSAVKGVGKVIVKHIDNAIATAAAVLRKLGYGDPIAYINKIDWQDLGKQSSQLIKEKITTVADALNEILNTAFIRWSLPREAIENFTHTEQALRNLLPKIDQGINHATSQIEGKVNQAIQKYEGELPHRGNTNTPNKVKTAELDKPEGNDLKGAKVVKMKQHDVACFKKNKKGNVAEYDRQLAGQQAGLNNMTVKEYLDNRKAFKEIGRKGTGAAQKEAREKFKSKLIEKYEKQLEEEGFYGLEAENKIAALVKQDMKTLNALHNPDMIAGGYDKVLDLGDASVNQSIGSQWNRKGGAVSKRVDLMDIEAQKTLEVYGPHTKMNINLHRCK